MLIISRGKSREISSQPSLDVPLTPRSLKILLALCRVSFVKTTFPIYELQWNALLSRKEPALCCASAVGPANSALSQRRIDGLSLTAKRKHRNNFTCFIISRGEP